MSEKTYKPGNYPDLPPPPGTVGVYGWIKQNLFSSIKITTHITYIKISVG